MNVDDCNELDSNDDVPRIQVGFILYGVGSLFHGFHLRFLDVIKLKL